MPPPKYAPAATTCPSTSLALHSPAAGRSVKRAAGIAFAAAPRSAIAARTFSMMAAGASFAPCASR